MQYYLIHHVFHAKGVFTNAGLFTQWEDAWQTIEEWVEAAVIPDLRYHRPEIDKSLHVQGETLYTHRATRTKIKLKRINIENDMKTTLISSIILS